MPNTAREIRIAKLKAAAEERKRDTLERAEKAIRKLLFDNTRVTFPNIAKEAGVSVSYLYKYPELKKRVQHLRLQQEEGGMSRVTSPPPSDKSKDAIILRLRERIKQLEAEREEQKRHISALSGQMYEQSGEQELLKRLREENKRLSSQVKELEVREKIETASVVPLNDISKAIKDELSVLEIRLTPSLQEKILSRSELQVKKAIAVVVEAVNAGEVRSKARLFVKALEEEWEPSDGSLERKQEAREFSQWFDVARRKGLVQASRGTEKGVIVLTAKGKWVPYETLKRTQGWTLSELQTPA